MTFALLPHVSVSETDDGMVLLDEKTGRYWQLNGTGGTVLRLLLDGRTRDEVVTELSSAYPGAGERISADVTALLDGLRDARVVRQ
jgi:Coenzyme PQQ synthesis protein D (PqqD)